MASAEQQFLPPVGRGGPQFIPRPDGTRIGAPAPWAKFGAVPSIDQITAVIKQSNPYRPLDDSVDGKPPSAVLVPISMTSKGPELLLTRRSWTMRSHPGQISFPGGRRDPEDTDLLDTALRETEEEIGIHRSLITIVGELDHLTTVSSPAYIAPYVGLLDSPPELTISEQEVDGVLHVSLAELLDPSIYRQELWPIGNQTASITFFELEGDTLWGATARMVRNLLEAITGTTTADPFSGSNPGPRSVSDIGPSAGSGSASAPVTDQD